MEESGLAGQEHVVAPDKAADLLPDWLAAMQIRVPAWRHVRLTATPLSGGMTNLNYRVIADGAAYVLRIGGNATDLLGIDREAEYAAGVLAARLGLGPEVIAFLRPEGYLVTRFVAGEPISPEALRDPTLLAPIAGALRRFHDGGRIRGTFSPFRVVERYAALAVRFGVKLPAAFAAAREEARRLEHALYPAGEEQGPRCPCHNDLLNANFLLDGGRVQIIDWEYAGMGDRYFDLANLSANHAFTKADDLALLAAYFNSPDLDEGRLARLHLLRAMSLFREAMWGVAQQGISTIDFDFAAYADRHFEALSAWLAHPGYERWLACASGPE